MDFKLVSDFKPTGDQPEAIRQLTEGIENDEKSQVLLGVTGSGKTFTIANVIKNIDRPTLILSHNKTLAAQLYGEFKSFFPDNAVEYFVSYYDYYQPEAYLPTTDTYIEKDLAINDEIDKLRLRATAALLSGRKDVIVVSSVSCIYGMADPTSFGSNVVYLQRGQKINRNQLLRDFVDALYTNGDIEFTRGSFRSKGDVVDVFPSIETYDGVAYRIEFWGDEIDRISSFDPLSGQGIEVLDKIELYPANLFVTDKKVVAKALDQIQFDMAKEVEYMRSYGKFQEAKRLEERTIYDVEMIRELGYCSGIENYSRYFDGREAGVKPFCLLDYFPKDFLMVIDESHVTIPQIRAMYGGDHARKKSLIEYGFRLTSAFDNRPLTFDEFEQETNQVIYLSATPADYELEKSGGVVVEQIIRPTGIPDPIIEVVPSENQIDHLVNEINIRIEKHERVLVTTLTKRMAEELSEYFDKISIKCQYIHSDVDTIDRVKILENLRKGIIDVLVGVNLLREGLDLPEVSLVAILDADKEGFLRSTRSLTQTAGRAARNLEGKVIMYADKITRSMKNTIDATNYRRSKQINYNKENNIIPKQIIKSTDSVLIHQGDKGENSEMLASEPKLDYSSNDSLDVMLKNTKSAMQKAAKQRDYIEAARLRDIMFEIQRKLDK